jgi:adiponectin receptor
VLCLRIDYAGILPLIQSSVISGIYVRFYCEPFLQKAYWTMITPLSTIAAFLILHPKLQGLKWRCTPIGHGLLLYGWSEMWERSGMPFWLLEGVAYGIGTAFFTTRIPERLKRGWFDIWSSSHQIFYVCVVTGAAVHLWGVWDTWDWNYRNGNLGSCGVRG